MDVDESTVKVVIGVAAAVVGWVLAQLTSLIKDWVRARKIKALLLEELQDVEKEVDRVIFSLARDLQIYGAQGIDSSACIGVSNFIFANYYKDALLYLSQSQRISYQLIHSLVRNLNEGLESIRELIVEVHKHHNKNGVNEETAILGREWGELVKAQYRNAAALRWHVRYHLDNKRAPALSPMAEAHEQYLQYLSEVEGQVEKAIKSGESIERERFDEIYSPESFRK